MLKGHVFKYQTFEVEAFAHYMNTFLQGNMGVTKGCDLSYATDSVTIEAGYFCVYGRFLEIVGSETISDITNTGYYKLICNIDLSKENTTSELTQATIEVVKASSAYPALTQEDLDNDGTVYQYEFARFKVEESGITSFTDMRTFLSFDSIYTIIENNFEELFSEKTAEMEALVEEIKEELASVEDGSAYLLKTGGTIDGDLEVTGDLTGTLTGDCSGNAGTATKLKTARTISLTGAVTGSGSFNGSANLSIATTKNHNHSITWTQLASTSATSYTAKTVSNLSNYTTFVLMFTENDRPLETVIFPYARLTGCTSVSTEITTRHSLSPDDLTSEMYAKLYYSSNTKVYMKAKNGVAVLYGISLT